MPIRVLIEHGTWNNIGDEAMLEAIVDKYIAHGNVECHVPMKPGLHDELWEKSETRREDDYLIRGCLAGVGLSRIPIVSRFASRLSQRMDVAISGRFFANEFRSLDGKKHLTLGKYCREFDALHISGGGNLTDLYLTDLWRKCELINCFAAQKKPIVLTGQQVGPFRSSQHGAMLYRALRKVDFVGLREPLASVSHCRNAKLSEDHYCVMGDDSFGLAAAPEDDVVKYLKAYGLDGDGFIAANVRIGHDVPQHAANITKIANALQQLSVAYELPLLVVPIAFGDKQSDIESGYRLQAALDRDIIMVLNDPTLTARMAKGILGQARAAVGVSYHFCTFSLSQGVPAVCLYDGDYYSQKGQGICAFWGDERLAVSIRTLSSEEIVRHVRSVVDDRHFCESLCSRGKDAVDYWNDIVNDNIHAIFTRCLSI